MCIEPIDFLDHMATTCFCGYKVCGWCFGYVMDNQNGQCPGCAGPIFAGARNILDSDGPRHTRGERFYAQHLGTPNGHMERGLPNGFRGNLSCQGGSPSSMDRPSFMQIPPREMANGNMRDRSSSFGRGAPPGGITLDRRSLQNLRVIQRHLIYVIGLPPSLSNTDTLASADFFGQYGKVVKVVVNTHEGVANDDPRYGSVSAYVTFQYRDDARAAIRAVDGFWLEGRHLRASFGTTKYCNNFARSLPCTNPDCLYLHELGEAEDRFTKEEIQAGLARQHAAMDRDFILTGKVLLGGASGTGLRPTKPVLPPPQLEVPVPPGAIGVPPVAAGSSDRPPLVPPSPDLGGQSTPITETSPPPVHPPRPLPPRQTQAPGKVLPRGMTSLLGPKLPPDMPSRNGPRLPPRSSPSHSPSASHHKWMYVEPHQRPGQRDPRWYAAGAHFGEVNYGLSQLYNSLVTQQSDRIGISRRALSLDSVALTALESRQIVDSVVAVTDPLSNLQNVDVHPLRRDVQRAHSVADPHPSSSLPGNSYRGFAHSAVFPPARSQIGQVSNSSDTVNWGNGVRLASDLSVDPYASPDLRAVSLAQFLDSSLPPVDCEGVSPKLEPVSESALLAPFFLSDPAASMMKSSRVLQNPEMFSNCAGEVLSAPVSVPIQSHRVFHCQIGEMPSVSEGQARSHFEGYPVSVLSELEKLRMSTLTPQNDNSKEEGIIWGSFHSADVDCQSQSPPDVQSQLQSQEQVPSCLSMLQSILPDSRTGQVDENFPSFSRLSGIGDMEAILKDTRCCLNVPFLVHSEVPEEDEPAEEVIFPLDLLTDDSNTYF